MGNLKLAVIGVGSNLGSRLELIQHAHALMERVPHTHVLRCAPIYETVAIGPVQPDYLNTAWRVETELTATELFAEMMRIERELGRAPRSADTKWQARTIDLDLLWMDSEIIETDTLHVPHPELTKRAFALAPLLDVMPELHHEYADVLSALGGPPQIYMD